MAAADAYIRIGADKIRHSQLPPGPARAANLGQARNS
jgi:hypothetical protein